MSDQTGLGLWVMHMAIFLSVVGGFITVIRLIQRNGKGKP